MHRDEYGRRRTRRVPEGERLESRVALSGGLDPGFGAGGKVTIPVELDGGSTNASATAMVALPDGQVLLGGNASPVSTYDESAVVARLNSNGSLDSSFGQGGMVILPAARPGDDHDVIAGMATEPNGDIVVVETAQESDVAVARLTPVGALDPTFGKGGEVLIPIQVGGDNSISATGVALQADGKIVVFGTAENSLSDSWAVVARLDADGSLDSTFGQGGLSLVSFRYHGSAVSSAAGGAVQPDGQIVVFGSSGPQPRATAMTVARLNPDGSLDTAFGSGGIATDGGSKRGNLVALGGMLQSDGKIVVTGTEYAGLADSPFAAVRFNTDGTIDRTFHKTGVAISNFNRGGLNGDEAHGVVETAGGDLVLGGMTWPRPPKFADFGAVVLTPTGQPDKAFSKTGRLVIPFNLGGNNDDEAFAEALQPDGQVLLAGYAATSGRNTDMAVIRLTV